jgi:hypothetical protein
LKVSVVVARLSLLCKKERSMSKSLYGKEWWDASIA